jgi:alpha-beta hydrolase superfamily lysophospholipase
MRSPLLRVDVIAAALIAAAGVAAPTRSCAATATISIRGHQQTLHLYGSPQSPPVIVSSGDGGWVHLGPHIAEQLAANGYFVVGFDVKAYLESFTAGKTTLQPQDEPGDYRIVADFAARTTGRKPILIGVSEGAGLSVLAATDPQTKAAIAGVIGVGLPDFNELAWHWRDALIYVTHNRPNEPGFSTAAIVDRMTPVPLAAIHATQDEFVPLAEVQEVVRRAGEPKKMWIVPASNHRFSDNLAEFDRRLVEAVGWIERNVPR